MIPQVNAGVTDRNREQTKRICESKGAKYWKILNGNARAEFTLDAVQLTRVDLPNGSLTLDQVVGMLDESNEQDCEIVNFEEHFANWRWLVKGPPNRNGFQTILGEYFSENPHNLTAAMDALIKVLEAK